MCVLDGNMAAICFNKTAPTFVMKNRWNIASRGDDVKRHAKLNI